MEESEARCLDGLKQKIQTTNDKFAMRVTKLRKLWNKLDLLLRRHALKDDHKTTKTKSLRGLFCNGEITLGNNLNEVGR